MHKDTSLGWAPQCKSERHRSGPLSEVVQRCRSVTLSQVVQRCRSGPLSQVVQRCRSVTLSPIVQKYRSGLLSPVVQKYRSGPLIQDVEGCRSGPLSPVVQRYMSGPLSPVVQRYRSGPLSVACDLQVIFCTFWKVHHESRNDGSRVTTRALEVAETRVPSLVSHVPSVIHGPKRNAVSVGDAKTNTPRTSQLRYSCNWARSISPKPGTKSRKRKRNCWYVVMVKSYVCVCVSRLRAVCSNSPVIFEPTRKHAHLLSRQNHSDPCDLHFVVARIRDTPGKYSSVLKSYCFSCKTGQHFVSKDDLASPACLSFYRHFPTIPPKKNDQNATSVHVDTGLFS